MLPGAIGGQSQGSHVSLDGLKQHASGRLSFYQHDAWGGGIKGCVCTVVIAATSAHILFGTLIGEEFLETVRGGMHTS